MTGDKYRDLGGGLVEYPDDDDHGTPAMLTNGKPPTCPRCGETHNPSIEVVNRPEGRYFCACGTLFNGGDREWHMWSRRRKEYKARLAGEIQPAPMPRFERKVVPIRQRLSELRKPTGGEKEDSER